VYVTFRDMRYCRKFSCSHSVPLWFIITYWNHVHPVPSVDTGVLISP